MSLRARIVIIYMLLVVAAFSSVIYLIMNDVRPRYLEAVEESTVNIAELLAALLAQNITGDALSVKAVDNAMQTLATRDFSAKIYNITKRKVVLRIYVTDNQGMLLYDSTGETPPGTDFSNWRDVHRTLKGKYGARSSKTIPNDPSSRVIYIAAPIMHEGKLFGVVSVGKPTDTVSFFINIAQKRFTLSLLLVAVTAIGLSFVLSAWITRPVKQLIHYMQSIRQGKKEQLPSFGASEITELGNALQEMQAELEGKNYIEDYVRALTHEMKSPLTGIKGAGEILRDQITDPHGLKFLDNIETEVNRLQSLVERMLQLSRLENVRTIKKTTISVAHLFQNLADTFATQLTAKKLHLGFSAQTTIHVEGDELLLRQAIGNIIANAIDFSPIGSTISVEAAKDKGNLQITVSDQGEGIPDFALDKVFDKFFSLNRPGSGKKSTGLGLPFVKEVLSLHQATIALENAKTGLTVRMTFLL